MRFFTLCAILLLSVGCGHSPQTGDPVKVDDNTPIEVVQTKADKGDSSEQSNLAQEDEPVNINDNTPVEVVPTEVDKVDSSEQNNLAQEDEPVNIDDNTPVEVVQTEADKDDSSDKSNLAQEDEPVKINENTPLEVLPTEVEKGNPNVKYQFPIRFAKNNTPAKLVLEAIEKDDLEKVKQLVQKYPSLIYQTFEKEFFGDDTYSGSLLHLAVQADNLILVKFLLEQGCDPTVKDSQNFTPIVHAHVVNNEEINKEITRYLMANGSNDPINDCTAEELPIKLQVLISDLEASGNDMSRDVTQLIRGLTQRFEDVSKFIAEATQNVDMKDYVLTIPERKTGDFYKRFIIKDDLEYLGNNQVEYWGIHVQAMDSYYSEFHNIRASDHDLADLVKAIPQVSYLDIECKKITDIGFQQIKELKQLRTLVISENDNITDAGLEGLKNLRQLDRLYMGRCKNITDAGLQHLSGLTNLTRLGLSGNKGITDAGLKYLSGLAGLTRLGLSGNNSISGDGFQYLKGLTNLKSLDLSKCENLSDDGVKHLATLTQLTNLELYGCLLITDDCLDSLSKLTQLKTLHFENEVSLDEIIWGSGYPKTIRCPNITNAGISRLQELLPNCTIVPNVKTR